MAGSSLREESGQSSGLSTDAAVPGGTSAADKKQGENFAHTVLLVGNLNVGKTTLFNRVCGKRLTTSNHPGTTIAIGRGTLFESGTEIHLIDTPGVNGMMPESEDEKISQDILFSERPDVIALVADGKNLRKSLLLAAHLVEYDIPLLLDINMMDEVRQRGIHIDADRLSSLVNVPVVETVASEGEGVPAFRRALTEASAPQMSVSYPVKVESGLARISELLAGSRLPPRAAAVALLVGEHDIKDRVAAERGADVLKQIETIVHTVRAAFIRPLSAIILEARLQAVDQLLSAIQSVSPPVRMPFSEKIGEWSRRPLTGIPIAALVICATYLFVGQLGAQTLVGIFEGKLFGEWIIPATERALSWVPSSFVVDVFVGEFGLVSVGLALAFGVVVPVLVTFFFAFGILEDSGYLPRLSVLLDRMLRTIGLNGKGLLPLVLGFSCISMAILTTRILETKRERFIATFLLVLGLPCAPLLAVMLALLAGMSIWAPVTVFGVIITQIIVVGIILARLLPGRRSDFILELPPIRVPKLQSLAKKTVWRVWWFIKEAVPLFLLATFLLLVLDKIGTLGFLERAAKPVMTGLLGLPEQGVEVVIMTLIRRESGAAILKQFSESGMFDSVQVVVCLLVLTFLSPCVNAVLIMLKERGVKGTLAIMVFVTSYALAVGTVVNYVCRAFNVSFE